MPFRLDDAVGFPPATDARLRTTLRSWLDLLQLEASQSSPRSGAREELPVVMKYASRSGAWANLSRDDFEDIRFIAKGSFGKVSLVRHKATQRMFALKEMAGAPGNADKVKKLGLDEADIMKSIRHPFIVNLQHVFFDDFSVSLAMEFVPGEDLWSMLYEKKQAPISESRAADYLAQIALALEYLHDNGIVYCDLKSENVIIDVHGYVRLVDFGCAQRVHAGAVCKAKCGTIQCLAPEALSVYFDDAGGYSFPADYWALGILAYELIVGHAPFTFDPAIESPKQFAVRVSIESGDLRLPRCVSEPAAALLRGLLDPNPYSRLDKRIRECDFFAGIDFHGLTRKNPSFPRRIPSDTALSSKI